MRVSRSLRLSDFDQGGRQMSVKRVQAAEVRDHDVVAVSAARAADERHDPIVGRIHGRPKRLDEIDSGVEVRIAAVRRFEPVSRRTEGLRDLRLWLGPDEAVLGRVP